MGQNTYIDKTTHNGFKDKACWQTSTKFPLFLSTSA